ncbi:MAG: hypothetical protein J1E60_02840 [Christensenellaceae bacterium]|nr:hypothetical protein [Christensenellaceae bacterium]
MLNAPHDANGGRIPTVLVVYTDTRLPDGYARDGQQRHRSAHAGRKSADIV